MLEIRKIDIEYMKKKKNYIFAHMSVKAWGGGGLKTLAEISAKTRFF